MWLASRKPNDMSDLLTWKQSQKDLFNDGLLTCHHTHEMAFWRRQYNVALFL